MAGVIVATLTSIIVTVTLGVAFVAYIMHKKRKQNNDGNNENHADNQKEQTNDENGRQENENESTNVGGNSLFLEDAEATVSTRSGGGDSQSFDICSSDTKSNSSTTYGGSDSGERGLLGLNAEHLLRLNDMFAATVQTDNDSEEEENLSSKV